MLPPHGYWILPYILFYKQLQICISIYCYVNISLIFNSFYNTALSDKNVSLFNLLFQIRPENQLASLVSKLIWAKVALAVTSVAH